MSIPISLGTGAASVAAEAVGGLQYQQIEVYGKGAASVLTINPDGSINASIIGIPPAVGSVVAFQGGAPWAATNVGSVITTNIGSVVAVLQSSSILAVPVGSVITVLQAPSIVGTYAEDATHSPSDKGLFAMAVRNDTNNAFTTTDVDYSPIAVDLAGRVINKPFSSETSRIEGYNSVVSTSVTTLVSTAGSLTRNYITDIMVANTGAVTTLITFKDGAGSILGYTIAPAGGGSNMIGFATPMRTGNNTSFDFQATAASSILYVTVKGYKGP